MRGQPADRLRPGKQTLHVGGQRLVLDGFRPDRLVDHPLQPLFIALGPQGGQAAVERRDRGLLGLFPDEKLATNNEPVAQTVEQFVVEPDRFGINFNHHFVVAFALRL